MSLRARVLTCTSLTFSNLLEILKNLKFVKALKFVQLFGLFCFHHFKFKNFADCYGDLANYPTHNMSLKAKMDHKEDLVVFPFMLWDDAAEESLRKEIEQVPDQSCWNFDSSILYSKNRREFESWPTHEAAFDERSLSPSTIDSGFDSPSFDTSLNNSTDWNPISPTSISALPVNPELVSNGSKLCSQFTEYYELLTRHAI